MYIYAVGFPEVYCRWGLRTCRITNGHSKCRNTTELWQVLKIKAYFECKFFPHNMSPETHCPFMLTLIND